MKKMFLTFVAALTLFGTFFTPNFAFAAEEGASCTCSDGRTGVVVADTSILSGCDCSGNHGGAIIEILYTVIDFLSIGIGVLAVLGITIIGVQYLTAGGSEEKTRKAKNRMTEIIIGLAIYAVFYAIIKWLHVAQ